MWLKILTGYWREMLIIFLIFGVVLTSSRLDSAKAERDLAIANLDSYKAQAEQIANAARQTSNHAAREAANEIQELVAAAESKAFDNAKAKFGRPVRCPLGDGVRLNAVPAGVGGAEASLPPANSPIHQPELVAVDRAFIAACGHDAGLIEVVKRWSIANELPLSERE